MKLSLFFTALIYLAFANGARSYDPMTWSVEAIFCCTCIILLIWAGYAGINYLEPPKHN